MTSNKSDNFMTQVLICLVVTFTIVNAPHGNTSTSTKSAESGLIPVPSVAYECLKTLENYCDKMNATLDDCAAAGILSWRKGEHDTPNFVEAFFNSFKGKLIVDDTFELPCPFCSSLISKRLEIVLESFSIIMAACKKSLEIFKVTNNTIQLALNETLAPKMSTPRTQLYDTMYNMRQDILQYAFFETKLNLHRKNSFEYSYIQYISEMVRVKSGPMHTPKAFCLNAFPNEMLGENDENENV